MKILIIFFGTVWVPKEESILYDLDIESLKEGSRVYCDLLDWSLRDNCGFISKVDIENNSIEIEYNSTVKERIQRFMKGVVFEEVLKVERFSRESNLLYPDWITRKIN